MAINKLNKVLIGKAIKSLPEGKKQVALSDGNNLYLTLSSVNPGLGTWSMIFRDRTGKRHRITLGSYNHKYDILTIEQARELAIKVTLEIRTQGSSALVKYKQKIATSHCSLCDLYERYLENKKQIVRPNTLKAYKVYINVLKQGKLYDMPAEDINLEVFKAAYKDDFKNNKRLRSLKFTASFINTLRNFGAKLSLIPKCSSIDINLIVTIPKSKNHPFVKIDNLPAFFENLRDKAARPIVKLNLLILILSMCRYKEVEGFSSNELSYPQDNNYPIWTIPVSRMKNRIAHAIPLAPLLNRCLKIYNPQKGHERELRSFLKGLSIDQPSIHGMRATASTALNMLYSDKVENISRCLSHSVSKGLSSVDSHYNHYNYLKDKYEVYLLWENYLLQKTCIEEIICNLEQTFYKANLKHNKNEVELISNLIIITLTPRMGNQT